MRGPRKEFPRRIRYMEKKQVQAWIEEYLKGTDYELITLEVSAGNDILVEVDRLAGVDVDFCAELNRYLVEKIENAAVSHQPSDLDYSLEVGSVSLMDPFKTKMQFEKNLGHDVEVLVVESRKSKDRPADSKTVKYRGQLVSVDEETFSVDCEEKVKPTPDEVLRTATGSPIGQSPSPVKGGEKKSKRPQKQIVTHTWRYDEPKYVRYDLKF